MPNEISYWGCRVADSLGFSVRDVLQGVSSAADPSLRQTDLNDLDGVRNAVFYALAGDCLGIPVSLPEQWKVDITATVSRSPTLALLAEYAGLLVRDDLYSPSSATVSDLVEQIASSGCDDWALAESAAVDHFSASVPVDVEKCLHSTSVVLSDPQILDFLCLADWGASNVSELMLANPLAIRIWTQVEESYTTDWDTPIGLGTLSNTRDAARLLVISDSEVEFVWMRRGVEAAIAGYRSGERELTDLEAADLLVLCDVYALGTCPTGLKERVSDFVKNELASLAEPPMDDFLLARLVDTATWADLDVDISCPSGDFRQWMATSPLTAMAIGVGHKECYEEDELTSEEASSAVFQKLSQNDVNGAVSWAMLRWLLESPNDDYRAQARQAWVDMIDRLRELESPDAIDKARPLTLELMHADFEQWVR
jgi:hypothetical protein